MYQSKKPFFLQRLGIYLTTITEHRCFMKTDPCNCFATNIKTVNKKKPLKVFWINNSVYRCRCRNQCCIVKKGGNASTKKKEPQCEI